MLYYEMALRRWTELELGLSAQLKCMGWEYFLFKQHLFHRSNNSHQSSTRFVGLRVLRRSGAETSAPGKALPSRSHHGQQTAFMASRKITWYLFPPYDKRFRDTYSSPVAYTNG